jgi:hypothetical protein
VCPLSAPSRRRRCRAGVPCRPQASPNWVSAPLRALALHRLPSEGRRRHGFRRGCLLVRHPVWSRRWSRMCGVWNRFRVSPAWRPALGCRLRSVRARPRSRFSSVVDRPSKPGGRGRRQVSPTQRRSRRSTVTLLIPPHFGRALPVTWVGMVISEGSHRLPASWVVSARPPPVVHPRVRAPAICCTRSGYSGIQPHPCQPCRPT